MLTHHAYYLFGNIGIQYLHKPFMIADTEVHEGLGQEELS